ncbi:endospore germination permease [uncultured Clostridium sp.]|uniref:GerAB/ArcD/ProY family transporter n=1 Tax=uncultured Clostridium sp. TaxID=59620 RepID=UPI0028ED30FF|nr:endospore germination permease [uncultured Clostridium sp.]
MNVKDKNFISNYGLFSTLVVTIVGVNVFSYPSELANILGVEGWIAIIISGIIAILFIYMLNRMIKNNNYKHIYEIFINSFGQIFGRVTSLFFVFYSIYFVSLGLRIFTEEIKMYMLEKTPTEFIFLITILVGAYIVRGEIDNLIKFNEISFWVMFIPVILIFVSSIHDADFTNLLPIFNQPIPNYIKGATLGINRYIGFEILILIIPFVKEKEDILKITTKGIVFVILFYILIFVLAIGFFGKEQTKLLLWPTITMMKSVDIPGYFIERWEGIMMSIWIIFYFTTFVNHYYFSSDVLRKVMDYRDIKLSTTILVPFIYLIALYPKDISEVYMFSKTYMSIFFAINIIIVILALFISSMKGGKKPDVISGE